MIRGPELGEPQRRAHPSPGGIEVRQPIALDDREIHVWELPLDRPETEALSPLEVLAPVERQRADRLRDDLVRRRFVVSHAATRVILSNYLETAPQDLRFLLGDQGKPRLPAPPDSIGLQFNLAHSGDLGLLAVGRGRPLGIDLEQMRSDWDYREVVDQVLNHRELRRLDQLPAALRREAFYAAWCRKEAYLKGLGVGIADRMLEVEVSVDPSATTMLLLDDRRTMSRWQLLDVPVPGGYKACLAVEQAATPAWKATCTTSVLNAGIPLILHVAA